MGHVDNLDALFRIVSLNFYLRFNLLVCEDKSVCGDKFRYNWAAYSFQNLQKQLAVCISV